jgi:FlaG/FlaF family flagellin (archaellin)
MGEKLHMTQQNISYRVNVIRTKYPELLNGTNTLQTVQTKNTNTLQTIQTVQTNSTNTLQTVQMVQTNTKKDVCEADPVCQSSVKPDESKKKFDREAMKKNGFDF